MSVGSLTLRHHKGTEVFAILDAFVAPRRTSNGCQMFVEINPDSDPVSVQPEGTGYGSRPGAEWTLYLSEIIVTIDELSGKRYSSMPSANADSIECEGLFSYFEHEEITDSLFSFSAIEADRIFLQYSGATSDPNDPSPEIPFASLEIEAWCRFIPPDAPIPALR